MTTSKPSTIVFDVNETLSDMSPIGGEFAHVGLPESMAKLWFASVLRDGFALAASGTNQRFADVAAEVLRGLVTAADPQLDMDDAVRRVMQAMAALDVHADVVPGIRQLSADGYRLATLTNGSVQTSDGLLSRAGVREHFDRLLSVEDAPAWKPAPCAYEYAIRECEADAGEMMLVAVHPWDIHGAARAGLQTAWINRSGASYPGLFEAPDMTAASLVELGQALRDR